MERILLNGDWKVKKYEHNPEISNCYDHKSGDGEWIEANVPGDIHKDLQNAGKISDPYYSDQFLDCKWVTEKDWCFVKEFDVPEGYLKKYVFLNFEGIDTFADIYLNGKLVQSCDNMFLKYEIPVKDIISTGKNLLAVKIKSIKKMADGFPEEGYFGCFNIQRIFIRKIQCHFSWDWAPDFPATGIYKDVYLETHESVFIHSVGIRTKCDGSFSFHWDLSKSTYYENKDKKDGSRCVELEIEDPESGYRECFKSPAKGLKNFITGNISNPVLWWPCDMGNPHLYNYSFSLYEGGKLLDRKKGNFGIREIKLKENIRKDAGGLTCQIDINGKPAFMKGANWVPLDIMTGAITEIKYEKAVIMAKEANFNTLRVWGGSLYESDFFYNLCDRLGIMVWQDLAFACSDVPDDQPGFMDKIIPEIEYQVERLRMHPSLVVWSGGNEKTGAFGELKTRGDKTIYYMARGIIGHLDPTRPYFPSSPWSYTDLGNDHTSGDTHCNSYQSAMNGIGISRFREVLAGYNTPMASEIAVQGAPTLNSLKKYIPKDKLWPTNQIWEYHFTRNPYDGTGTTFIQQQKSAANELFGEFNSVCEFVKKSMTVHSEFVKADVEYHRSRKGDCAGAMLWMFSDVWPCGTWAILDYYLEPKASYYSAMRSFRPVSPIITQTANGIQAYVVNDTLEEFAGEIEISQKKLNGENVSLDIISKAVISPVKSNKIFSFGKIDSKADYLSIKLVINGEKINNSFFHKGWKNVIWNENPIEVNLENMENNNVWKVKIAANSYARMVRITVPVQEKAKFTDNYFDMEAGEEKYVILKSEIPVDKENIKVTSWVDNWE